MEATEAGRLFGSNLLTIIIIIIGIYYGWRFMSKKLDEMEKRKS